MRSNDGEQVGTDHAGGSARARGTQHYTTTGRSLSPRCHSRRDDNDDIETDPVVYSLIYEDARPRIRERRFKKPTVTADVKMTLYNGKTAPRAEKNGTIVTAMVDLLKGELN